MKTIIFIIGAGHSGSTLLAKALNAHSMVFALSEISQFYNEMQNDMAHCGCGTKLRDCAFWEDVNDRLRERIGFGIKDDPNRFRISRNPDKNTFWDKIYFKLNRIMATYFMTTPKSIKASLENIYQLFDAIMDKTGNAYLVDSSKSTRWAFLVGRYLKKRGYQIKVIHLVRDGRGVLYSYLKGYYKVNLKNPETNKYEMQTFYSDKKRQKEEIVNLWKRDNFGAYTHRFINHKDYFFLRYEDFTTHSTKSLKGILAFLGLPYEEEMHDLNRYENHMVSGNASRINAERILKPFENWEKKLSHAELAYFQKKGGWLNKKLGYSE
jgi:hypothetical protein